MRNNNFFLNYKYIFEAGMKRIEKKAYLNNDSLKQVKKEFPHHKFHVIYLLLNDLQETHFTEGEKFQAYQRRQTSFRKSEILTS
jgi:hypothetical protein